MVAETTEDGRDKAPRRTRHHRRVPARLDRRLATSKRVEHLIATFRAHLGPDADDEVLATAIRRAAETVALSEDLRARMLRGEEKVSPDDVLRTTRAADALTRRLHLDRRKPAQASLADYLRGQGGAP